MKDVLAAMIFLFMVMAPVVLASDILVRRRY
jgi:hypothetical protein